MALQPQLQMTLHVRPFSNEDAVDVRVPHRTVLADLVVADHAILLRPQRFDRLLRAEIEVVRPQAHHLATECLERVREEHQLARSVDVRPLPTPRIPGVADLDAIDLRHDIVISGAADDLARYEVADHPGKHVARLVAAQSRGHVRLCLMRLRHDGEPQLPKLAIRSCLADPGHVFFAHRLEPDRSPLEDDWCRSSHRFAIISVLIRYQGADNMVKDSRTGLPRLPVVGEARRGPEGYLTYLLRQANASVRLALDRALAKENMTYPQQSALTMIRAYEAISAADLARLTMLTPQTVNGIVRALETRGAIRKEPDQVNGRILRLI